MQDGLERHVWGSLKYTDASGAVMSVRGTGTNDEEATLLNSGYAFNVEDDFNTEVFLLAGGSDLNQKFAIISIPRDKQRKWKTGTGGIQSPVNPDKAVEFNDKRTQVTEDNFAVAMSGIFEVKDGVVYVRADVRVQGTVYANGNVEAGGNVTTASFFIGPEPFGSGDAPPAIPGFDP